MVSERVVVEMMMICLLMLVEGDLESGIRPLLRHRLVIRSFELGCSWLTLYRGVGLLMCTAESVRQTRRVGQWCSNISGGKGAGR